MVLRMAWRNIIRQRRRSLLTLMSLSFSYLIVCASISFQEGSYDSVISQFTKQHLGHLKIHREGYNEKPSLYKTIESPREIQSELKQFSEIRSVLPRVQGFSLFHGRKKVTAARVVGIDFDRESRATGLSERVASGKYPRSEGSEMRPPVLLGSKLAQSLRVSVGDEVAGISQGKDGSVATELFYVIGIVGSRDALDSHTAYISLKSGQEFFSLGGEVHELMIMTSSYRESIKLARRLRKLDQEGLEMIPWQEAEKEFYKTMEADKQGGHVFFVLILLMVLAGILNTVLMSVFERAREYGVLMAIGSSQSLIFTMIMTETLMLACGSILVGFLICVPMNYWFVHYGIVLPQPLDVGGMMFDRIRGEMSLYTLGYPAILIFMTSFFATLYPAYIAVRRSPIEALRSY